VSGSQGDSVGDGLVIWINGGFGAGKTTAARALVKRRPEMLAFDAEQIGFLLRRAMPKENWVGDFQDFPLWRELTVRTIVGLRKQCGRSIVVPMSVTRTDYFEEVMSGLREAGVAVRHFTLVASAETLKARLRKRWSLPGSERWAKAQIERCRTTLAGLQFEKHVATDGRKVEEIVDEILAGVAQD